ncbi:hypothetical protein [Neptunicella marina]|uniref:Uncharacterized protein n=1 Tax=Neptunicella marina TaxID=2125989 RepID=A0A8J6ITP4_9ALTE|nr:hypothetical protein [Neptunicella marina]MBC3765223.1 hypothetical protein [Neptunicella marina]
MKEFKSVDIALAQLESALMLYFETNDYFSVITLAGAAEEILGKACRAQGIKSSLESLQDSYFLLNQIRNGEDVTKEKLNKWVHDRVNYARNKIKHVNPINEPVVSIFAEHEAKDLLNRAIDNWWALGNPFTNLMLKFYSDKVDSADIET